MIKLITHTDLDGVSCAILGILAYGINKIDISYCNYDDVDNVALSVFENHEEYEQIFITDISVNKEVADKLNTISDKVLLLDHHPTALFLNDYDFCDVTIEIDGEKTCGTSMFFNYLDERFVRLNEILGTNFDIESIFKYTEIVRKWDTWLWAEKYNDTIPRDLNNLFYLYGRDRFVNKLSRQLKYHADSIFTDTDKLLLELDNSKKESYILNKDSEIMLKTIQGYNVGIVFAEQYISELGNELAKKHKELDFIVIISDNKISYRSIRDDINVGEIAKVYGGGGHPKASGSQISLQNKEKYLSLLFDK